MDYTIKRETDAATGRLFVRMAQRNHADDQDRATELEIYLPAGVTPPFDANRVERLWTMMFNHRI